MKKIYIVSFALLLLFGANSCKKDFLDVQPTQFMSDEQIADATANNPELIAGSMSGIYTLMFQTGTGGTNLRHDDFGQKGYDIYSDLLSADMALSVSTYGWYTYITEFSSTQDYTSNADYEPWRYYYRLIRSANKVINALGGNDVVPELDENKYIMGQAKAMRAHSYFYLSQLFANSYDPAEEILPIYTDPLQQNQPKSTTQEVYALIVKDLTEAIPLLDGYTRDGKFQINKYVAEGILAYVYATMGGQANYILAKDLAADVIANGGFTLMAADEVVYTGDPNIGGFNNANTPGWMWGVDLVLDYGLDLVSWWGQIDVFTYSYAWAGDAKAIDQGLYDLIPTNDVRKGQFYAGSGYYYLMPLNKFYDPGRVIGGQRNISTDYVYMRVAEMYLLNAETAAKAGFEDEAKGNLKTLLSQRIPDVTYVDGLTGQALLDEIYLQTRIELWGEGKSYLAMKRNQATIVRGSNHLSFVGEPIPYNDDRLTLLIPQSEVQNNPFIN